MRVLFLGNNALGLKALRWLRRGPDEVVGLVLNAPQRQRYAAELKASAGLPAGHVFRGDRLSDAATLRRLRSLKADVAVSVLFGHIVRRPFLELFPRGMINLHPALLPYNRGAYPNVWSILDGTPAGATLHIVDEGVDTGAVLAQAKVAVRPEDTGKSLYRRQEAAALALLKGSWPAFVAGRLKAKPQRGRGTTHAVRDVEAVDAIDLARSYPAGRLLDILRARSFPPHRGAYFIAPDGRRIHLRLVLEPEAPPADI